MDIEELRNDLNNWDVVELEDTVEDKTVPLALRFNQDEELEWFRYQDGEYLPTGISSETVPDNDEDAFEEMEYMAESELVLLVELTPRFKLHADWYSNNTNRRSYIHKHADNVTEEYLKDVRRQLFGDIRL